MSRVEAELYVLKILKKLMEVKRSLKIDYDYAQRIRHWVSEMLKELIEKIDECYAEIEEAFEFELEEDYYDEEEELE